ncbi:HNH endonuclease signature motif containing protein [Nostoc flagelliforme]|uniref:HNH endonuclease signature motif containing protein n=1 Tax=Nostoc flagelliforme TaxID=1306274 RepID=UPI000C2CE6F9|nr:HNH endonuclease signature motif containing protein [Nostoc flagelliforme]
MPDNGLLLRADFHTLFDLNLLGINPESLEVKFHPKVMETGYQKLEGRKLKCSKYKPSQSALESRWKQFLNQYCSVKPLLGIIDNDISRVSACFLSLTEQY